MRIGIDASRAAVEARTGTEQYSVALLGALAALDRTNEYRLYFNRLPRRLPPLGPNFHLRPMPFPRLWTHARLSAELLLRPPDTLFVPAHVLPFPGALRRPLRSVVTIHDLGYLRFPESHTRSQRLYLRLSTLWSAYAAQAVIAVSQATRQDLLAHARINPAKVQVVYHGVAPHFRPLPPDLSAATAARYGIAAPYFLYVGTLQPRKNLARLMSAYARARQLSGRHFPQLVLAGKVGWLSQDILAQARALGLAEAVRLPGYIGDDDLPALLSGARAFVYPSLYEGFGMPLLEAMACGTPVLAANTSALPEVAGGLEQGGGEAAALLLDPLDEAGMAAALQELAEDAGLREVLRVRGLTRAAEFSWERSARETLRVLTSQP
jgi:glycosyltransferase involved in cell wall biosynthesis